MAPDLTAGEVIIGGLPLANLSFGETVERIGAWAAAGTGGYISTPNVDHVVRAQRDPAFRALVMAARLRVPDGMGIVYGARIARAPLRGSVTGRMLPQAVVARFGGELRLGLLGGRPGAAQQAAERLAGAGGQVVCAIGPSMNLAIDSPEDKRVVDTIREAGPQLLFVGLGSPKQEAWMARHGADLPRLVMVGIGQGLDVLGGALPAAPTWMTRVGLEWAYRLAREPRRLARRYLVNDPRFFWWMLRARLAASRR